MGALENSNLAAAQAVVEGDDRIDREERHRAPACLGLIACQQPVAGDLAQNFHGHEGGHRSGTAGRRGGRILPRSPLRRGNEVIPELLSVLIAPPGAQR